RARVRTTRAKAVIGNFGLRREDVDAIKKCRVSNDTLQGVSDLAANFSLVIETPLAIFHLTPQVRARVEPEACRVMDLVTRSIEIVQSIHKTIERIGVQRGRLARLQATEQDSSAVDAATGHL